MRQVFRRLFDLTFTAICPSLAAMDLLRFGTTHPSLFTSHTVLDSSDSYVYLKDDIVLYRAYSESGIRDVAQERHSESTAVRLEIIIRCSLCEMVSRVATASREDS
jgi:hypothetical protein